MKTLIVANWKCNPTTLKETRQFFNAIKKGLKSNKKAEVVICPPFVYIEGLKIKPRRSRLATLRGRDLRFKIGAQNCFWEEKGAFTGEISPRMLKDLGCQYVIIGHSERRQILGETDEMIAQKLKKVLELNLCPILCVGETAEERKKEETFKVLAREIKQGLKKVPKSQIEKVVIAYEPIWAIGVGNPCSSDEALTAALFIRKIISQIFSLRAAKNMRILYGGSVDFQNAKHYLQEEGINGLLVGGASLKPREFVKIVKLA